MGAQYRLILNKLFLLLLFWTQFNKFTFLFGLWCYFPCDQHKAFPLIPPPLIFRPWGPSFPLSWSKAGPGLKLGWGSGLGANFEAIIQKFSQPNSLFLSKPVFSQVFSVRIKEFQALLMSINRWEISSAWAFASWCNLDNNCGISPGTAGNQLGKEGSFKGNFIHFANPNVFETRTCPRLKHRNPSELHGWAVKGNWAGMWEFSGRFRWKQCEQFLAMQLIPIIGTIQFKVFSSRFSLGKHFLPSSI